jgi:hypothetical protein
VDRTAHHQDAIIDDSCRSALDSNLENQVGCLRETLVGQCRVGGVDEAMKKLSQNLMLFRFGQGLEGFD